MGAVERQMQPNISKIEPKHVQRYLLAAEHINGSVLDIACGCGYGSSILSDKAVSVLGVDYSKEAIDYAKSNYSKPNISFMVGDLSKLGDFDSIVSLETLEHIQIPIQKILELNTFPQKGYAKFYDCSIHIISKLA